MEQEKQKIKNVVLYLLFTTTIATSCLNSPINTMRRIVTPLAPSSIDSTLSVGDYTFSTKADTTITPIFTD